MKLTELRSAIVAAVQTRLAAMSAELLDVDVATAQVLGVVSPRLELERESTGYVIEIFALTRVPQRVTRGDAVTNYVFRVVLRRREFGETQLLRNGVADKFLDFTDALFSALALFHGSYWGVTNVRESDTSFRDMLETEHVHLALCDIEVTK